MSKFLDVYYTSYFLLGWGPKKQEYHEKKLTLQGFWPLPEVRELRIVMWKSVLLVHHLVKYGVYVNAK